MSIALWPFKESESGDWRASTPRVPADHRCLQAFADDLVADSREAARATLRVEDRCHQLLLLCIALTSLLIAGRGENDPLPIVSLILIAAAAVPLLKTRFPFNRPLGLKWPDVAVSLINTNISHDYRARAAYLLIQNHYCIQTALCWHLAASLILLAVALLAYATEQICY